MSIDRAPVAEPIPREIVGAMSAVFNDGSGPSGQYIDSAMGAAGLDSRDYVGNKAIRVRDALSATPPLSAWKFLDEIVHVTRDRGYFNSASLPGELVQLQESLAMFGGHLSDNGHMTWGYSPGAVIAAGVPAGAPPVFTPRTTVTTPEPAPAPPPPVAQTVGSTNVSHERLVWLLRRVPASFSALVTGRRTGHDPLVLADEYDLQDATEVALRLLYNDVRPEERTPSYGGSSTTQDFLLFEVKTMVEIKVTRTGRGNVKIREEIDIDSMAYLAHPNVDRMVFVVYDLAATITNPQGFQRDLSTPINGHPRDVLVVPWPYPV